MQQVLTINKKHVNLIRGNPDGVSANYLKPQGFFSDRYSLAVLPGYSLFIIA